MIMVSIFVMKLLSIDELEESGVLYDVYSTGIISGTPIIIVNIDDDLVILRLPFELMELVEVCIQSF
jgi:hypothetical protein